MGNEIWDNIFWVAGAAVLIYLCWGIFKRMITVTIMLAIAAAVFFLLMYNDETGDPRVPDFVHQIVSTAKQVAEQINKQIINKAEASKPDILSSSIVAAHNRWRFKVRVPALRWSDTLALDAQRWADELGKTCALAHADQNQHGENISKAKGSYTWEEIVDDWASEIKYYDYNTNSCAVGELCSHYTQIVWRETYEVGCAKSICDGNRGQVWVCRYNPPGNYKGERPY